VVLKFYTPRWVVHDGEENKDLDIAYNDLVVFARDYGIFHKTYIEAMEKAYLTQNLEELYEIYTMVEDEYRRLKHTSDINTPLVLAYADVYDKIYNDDTVIAHQHYMGEINKAYILQDVNALLKLYDSLHDQPKDRILSWYKEDIHKHLQCEYKEIEEILDDIKSTHEAGTIWTSITSLGWLTNLPKGYAEAKKIKNKRRNNKVKQYTYEQQLRLSRHILEKQLMNRHNVGINRSKRLSKILLSI